MGIRSDGVNEILEMLEKHQITPETGFKLIKELQQGNEEAAFDAASAVLSLMYSSSTWKPKSLAVSDEPLTGWLLVFDVNEDHVEALQHHFNLKVILVKSGESFQALGNHVYELNPARQEDYARLVKTLSMAGALPDQVVHMWCQERFDHDELRLRSQLERGFYSLLFFSKALMEHSPKHSLKLVFLYSQEAQSSAPQYACVSGLAKTLRIENPRLICKTIGMPAGSAQERVNVIQRELQAGLEDAEISYENNVRLVKSLTEYQPSERAESLPLKKHGVYLITGGAGGLGLLFADYLAKQYKARLVLTGRSDLDEHKEKKYKEWEALGAQVRYVKADVSKKSDVDRLLAEAVTEFQQIDGIIHSAGVIRDAFVIRKQTADVEEVLAPKIFGTVYLDEATKDMALDFFVMFSSLAGVFGNVGQCDYATGNSFMDHFAAWRTRQRPGKTLSINWPLWEEGAMQISAEERQILSQQTGLDMLPTRKGLIAWEEALRSDLTQCVVGYGDLVRGRNFFAQTPTGREHAASNAPVAVDSDQLKAKTEAFVKEIFGDFLNLTTDKIDAFATFQEYGVDSIAISQFNHRMEQGLGALPKTLLFEYQTIRELVDYLTVHHEEALVKLLGLDEKQPQAVQTKPAAVRRQVARPLRELKQAQHVITTRSTNQHESDSRDIAIIGLSGRYPNARNLEEFWDNLKNGKDSVGEIPTSRWDWRELYDSRPEKAREGKIYCKWGAFVENVDLFDPMFFNILPKEAEVMDPQERLFLEASWSALEDAGYTRKELREHTGRQKSANVGVFAGVTTTSYILNGADEWHKGNMVMPSSSAWSLANRVSFVFNFNGPSMPIDTACSSSLTAIHMACESLKKGECQVALAGGVNLYLHPSKYVYMCQMGMLSPTGRCQSFGEKGDGFVPGEGVGVVVLKPLRQAIADGDHIYGIIKGSAINHGGSTNGFTVPNPNAQAALIADALQKAEIDPATISYIEAHGTGTALGDPIEVTGLTKAFRANTEEKQFCAIGSAKSNIGHLESAAGIAGLTKVLLQMKHKKLVPSLHADTLNSNIMFEDTPFYVQRGLTEWKQPLVRTNGGERRVPRRAGISSFGAGGSNAHIVVEEYLAPAARAASEDREPQIIVLSARNKERLKAYAQQMVGYLQRAAAEVGTEGMTLRDVAYTLQVGREPLEERLAFLASSLEDLENGLLAYYHDDTERHGFYTGNRKSGKSAAGTESDWQALIRNRELDQLARLWSDGGELDWKLLYDMSLPRRISLPTYPFAAERYWIPVVSPRAAAGVDRLHSLVDANVSTFDEQCFVKTFQDHDLFLRDHLIDGKALLSGLVYLEMARVSGILSDGDRSVVKIQHVKWDSRLVAEAGQDIKISLYPDGDLVNFEVSVARENNRLVLSQGQLVFAGRDNVTAAATVEIAAIKERCGEPQAGTESDQLLKAAGLQLGIAYQTIQEVCIGESEALAKITLPASLQDTLQEYRLHPSLLQSVLQTAQMLVMSTSNGILYMPSKVAEVDIVRPLAAACYVHVTAKDVASNRFDAQVLDLEGNVLFRVRGMELQPFNRSRAAEGQRQVEAPALLYFGSRWVADLQTDRANFQGKVLVFDHDDHLSCALRAGIPDASVMLVKPGVSYKNLGDGVFEIDPADGEQYKRLFTELQATDSLPTCLLHLWLVGDVGGREDSAMQLDLGVHSIFHLIQTVTASKIKTLNRFIVLYGTEEAQPNPYVEMIPGYAKSLSLVVPSMQFSAVEVSASAITLLEEIILQEIKRLVADAEVRYAGSQRLIKKSVPLPLAKAERLPLRQSGVYLITGGCGALGLIFAKHLAENYHAKVVMVGRSAFDEQKQQILDELRSLGGEGMYVQADVASHEEMSNAIARVKAQFGSIHGVLHAAGNAPDQLITQKSLGEFQASLTPKVQGTVVLDEVTKNEPLDFFMMFSSTSSILGDFGQCDYALGNRFLDNYVYFRSRLQERGIRKGRSIAVNWPLWRSGGMHLSDDAETMYLKTSGMMYLEKEQGIEAFNNILAGDADQVLVIAGQPHRVNRFLNPQPGASIRTRTAQPKADPTSHVSVSRTTSKVDGVAVEKQVETDLKQMAFEVSGIAPEQLDARENLADIGFDSITLKEFSVALGEKYRFDVSPAVFFAHGNLQSLGAYLLDEHRNEIQAHYGTATEVVENASSKEIPSEVELVTASTEQQPLADEAPLVPLVARLQKSGRSGKLESVARENQPVAIIGINGMFAGSKNLEEFWQHLVLKHDLVTEVPSNRWDWRESFSPQKGELHKTYSKWGSFLDDVDKFDAHFFNISPREAALMDPQHRLMLEAVWKAIEDSGYRVSELAGREVGLFVGAQFNDYARGLQGITEGYAQIITGNAQPILSNRISYLLNFHGPSELIDTACSSSLVALHRAVKSIQNGESEFAVAGGVSLMLTPQTLIDASSMGMLSPDGRCRTFDSAANGYVKGEGVGALLLKSLDKAIADNDLIYAVIRGTAENHGGKANSLTAPNPDAQAALLIKAYEEAGVDPGSVTYLEAHGTGTELGDPVEINGMKKAFRELYKRQGTQMAEHAHCGIGSVKTNIGHLEPASGIAGVIKVLLSMKHQTLPGLVHFEEKNPFIDLQGSPFYLATETQPWKRLQDETGNPIPRRAGVSSFGFGGTNTHVVLEEYERPEPRRMTLVERPYVIVLSAKNEERLKAYAAQLAGFLDGMMKSDRLEAERLSLINFAYTLHMARDLMDERMAVVVESVEELIGKLERFSQGQANAAECYCGNVKEGKGKAELFVSGRAGEEFIRIAMAEKEYAQLARLWVSGIEIEWDFLYRDVTPERISLPTYPFARDRHWALKPAQPVAAALHEKRATVTLHPVVDSNESTFEEQCFKKVFTGEEFYLKDHGKILPGVVYLEMIRAAGNLSSRSLQVKQMKNVVFSNPIAVFDGPLETFVRFYSDGEKVDVEVSTGAALDPRAVHAQGKLIYSNSEAYSPTEEHVDVAAVMARCQGGRSGALEYYELLDSLGAFIGLNFKGIQEFYCNEREAISRVGVPMELEATLEQFVLHPVLMDGGLQTSVAWAYKTVLNTDLLYLPFVLGEIELINPSQRVHYAYVTQMQDQPVAEAEAVAYQILFLDEHGEVVVKIKDFSVRAYQPRGDSGLGRKQEFLDVLHFTETWEQSDLLPVASTPGRTGHVLIFDENEEIFQAMQERLQGQDAHVTLVKAGTQYRKVTADVYEIVASNSGDYRRLIAELAERGRLPDRLVHLWSRKPFRSDASSLQAQLEKGFYAAFHTCQALLKQQPGHPARLLYAYPVEQQSMQPLDAAVSGFAQTLLQEHPNFACSVLGYERTHSLSDMLDLLLAELEHIASDEPEIQYRDGRRHVKRLQELPMLGASNPLPLQERGVYLITGGTGGLGLIFASYLAQQAKARLVLTGRSALDEAKQQQIAELEKLGAEVMYLQADVAVRADVDHVVRTTKSRFGAIHGVIHSAGITSDALIINKTVGDLEAVLAPKLFGTAHLYEALREEPLDLFVMFSSISAVLGNRGQCDYAFANRFMDHFARIIEQTWPHCRALSINWPLWKEGGMRIDIQNERMIRQTFGMSLLETEAGVLAFEKAIRSPLHQLLVVSGEGTKIRQVVQPKKAALPQPTGQTSVDSTKPSSQHVEEYGTPDRLQAFFQQDLVNIMSRILDAAADDLDPEGNMSEFGFDSITFTELANGLNRKFGLEITPALFFAHSTPASIAATLCTEYCDQLERHYQERLQPVSATRVETVPKPLTTTLVGTDTPIPSRLKSTEAKRVQPLIQGKESAGPVAIIGMSGILPQSKDLQEYWRHLLLNGNLITEIPADRWDWQDYYGDPTLEENKTNVIWGGFMPDIDKFDPLFFNISPREAELMDPQERLVIQTVWKTMEDAGYKAADLSGSNAGLFVGVTNADYKELMVQAGIPTAMTHCFLVNRVSYLLNLHGPSEVVDTACSSSLVAIHRAVEAIQLGHCEIAFAGGVNVMACPNLYVYESKAGMLAPDGKCKTFDRSANGYVRGEGVGVIMLKPLSRAVADGDTIHAVIRGTAVNHGGHASSMTAPNPNAQSELLVQVYEKAEIDPTTVSYIEAHGTGTSLGDPIEINGLKAAFQKLYQKWNKPTPMQPHCGIGSVKTNIGHLESAAGIAGIFKVILSMQHQQIPGTIHFQEQNPYIQLEETPFSIVGENREWIPLRDEQGRSIPRRAGVSSFGIGGVNAHIVLEEYAKPAGHEALPNEGRQIVVLSAKNEERLKEYARDLIAFLEKSGVETDLATSGQTETERNVRLREELLQMASDVLKVEGTAIDLDEQFVEYGFDALGLSELSDKICTRYHLMLNSSVVGSCETLGDLADHLLASHREAIAKSCTPFVAEQRDAIKHEVSISLADLAYTLQAGRDAMEERLALAVNSLEELHVALSAFCDNRNDQAHWYRGSVKRRQAKSESLTTFTNRDSEQIAQLWVSGMEIDWKLLHNGKHQRLSLPTYPFAKERYWIPELEAGQAQTKSIALAEMSLHPLVGRNTSTLQEQRFSTRFLGSEFFLADHVVGDRMILPGAAYLEMVHAAGELAAERAVRKLRNIMWAQPVVVADSPVDVHIGLYPIGENVEFDVYTSDAEGQRIIHSQGQMEFDETEKLAQMEESLDLDAIKQRCPVVRNGKDGYAAMRQFGLHLGESFQSVQELFVNRHEALARIELPDSLQAEFGRFRLHPILIDAALQTVAGLTNDEQEGALYLPFALDELEIYRQPLPEKCYAYALPAADAASSGSIRKYNITLVDEKGQVLLRFNGFSTREMRRLEEASAPVRANGTEVTDDALRRTLTLLQKGELNVYEVDKILGGAL